MNAWGELPGEEIAARSAEIAGALEGLQELLGLLGDMAARAAGVLSDAAGTASPGATLEELTALEHDVVEHLETVRALLTAVAFDATADPFATTSEFKAFVDEGDTRS